MSETISKYLPFVKEQIEVQNKLAKRYKLQGQQWRENLHLLNAEKMRGLSFDIEETLRHIEKLENKPSSNLNSDNAINLRYEEIQGLPEELVSELSFSDVDKAEFLVSSIIDDAGGTASLDRILVDLYHKTKEVTKRTALTNRLYRMSNKGLVFSVSGKKGVYTTQAPSEEQKESETT